jgi:hypothetical protein
LLANRPVTARRIAMRNFSGLHRIGGYIQPEGEVIDTVQNQGNAEMKISCKWLCRDHCIESRHGETETVTSWRSWGQDVILLKVQQLFPTQ